MQIQAVLTIIGTDRPGLVETLSGLVTRHHGNWLESRMVRLAGKFAGVAQVSLPNDELDAFLAGTEQLASAGLRVIVETAGEVEESTGKAMNLSVVGNDRPGIVHEFSQALANRQINVIELVSDITSAPMTGDALFMASASILMPVHLDMDSLTEELELIANELTVEYTLEFDD